MVAGFSTNHESETAHKANDTYDDIIVTNLGGIDFLDPIGYLDSTNKYLTEE